MDYTLDDFMKDGESGGKEPKNIPDGAIQKGTDVEMEHTSDKNIARKIALDHLAEFPDYYDRLEKMENEARQQKKSAAYESWFSGNTPTLPLTIEQIKDQFNREDITAVLGRADARRVQTEDGVFVGIGSDLEYESAYSKAVSMLGSRGQVNELDSFFGPGQNYIVVLAGV
jgi:hypothetical protein